MKKTKRMSIDDAKTMMAHIEKIVEEQMDLLGIRPSDPRSDISVPQSALKLLLINTYLKGGIDKEVELKQG